MSLVVLLVLSLALGYAVVHSGGIDPAIWNVTMLVIGCAGAVQFLRPRRGRTVLDRWSTALLAVIALLSAVQVVPLPLAWTQVLSPLRYHDIQATSLFRTLPCSAPLSAAPGETIQYLLTLGGCLVTFLVVRSISAERAARPWIVTWPLLAIGAGQALLGFVQAYARTGEGLARGTYQNRDHYSALLELILPFALLYPLAILQRSLVAHESPAWPALKACLPLVMAALVLVGVVHSLSRGGFLSALGSLLVCGSLAFTLRGRRVRYSDLSISRLRRALPVMTVGLVVLLGFIYLPTDPLIARFSELAQTDDISADTRAQIWRDTASMVPAYRWLGAGWGTYQYTFLRFKSVAPMHTVDYVHNDYLQVLVEAGPLVFVLGILFLLRMIAGALRSAGYGLSPDQRYLAIASVGACTAILLHSVVDFGLYVPANALVFAWVLGISGSHGEAGTG